MIGSHHGTFCITFSAVEELGTVKGVHMMIRILRLFRVARILKLARHSESLQGFGKFSSSVDQGIECGLKGTMGTIVVLSFKRLGT